jgi:phenylacetate-CoA ligase
VRPEEITVDAIGQLPTTSKAEFAEFNTEFLAVPSDQVADIVFTSGTTGEPTPVMYTSGDMERLAFNEALSFAACGVTSADTALLTCTMDRCFVAGMAYYLGLRHLGAAVLRNGLGSLESHADVIRRMRPTLVVGVPTFLRRLGQHLEAKGFAPDRMGVRALVCIGEPLRDAALAPLPVATDIERLWGAPVHSTYASSEVVTSFCECSARRGGHLHPELCVVEILGDDGRPVPAGMIGEVTLTPLGLEGMPLVRFRTGDVSFLIDEPCSCGRFSPRLGPIIGRRNQLMKVNGTSLYPQAVQTALDLIPGLGEYYLVAGSQDTLSDSITIHASVRDSSLTVAAIMQLLQARLRVKPNVVIEPEAEILKQVFSAHSRKPIRFIDRRENQ